MQNRPLKGKRFHDQMDMDIQLFQNQSKQDRSRTRWTPALDKIFVDLVLDQVLQGNRANNVFSKMAWKNIRDEFNRQSGLEFNRKQLKKHLDVLRNRYYNVKSHIDQSGFGGDESRQVVPMTMFGEEVWEDYMEAYPVGEPTKIKDCPIYEQLCQIFSEAEGIGKFAQSSHYIELDKEAAGLIAPLSQAFPAAARAVEPVTPSTFVQDDSSSRSGADVNLDTEKKRKPVTASTGRRRGRPRKETQVFDEAIAEAMLEMAIASKLRADAAIRTRDAFSITKCVELLDEIPELDEDFYLSVLDLFENPVLREIFVSLKNERRLLWLQGKCTVPCSTMGGSLGSFF